MSLSYFQCSSRLDDLPRKAKVKWKRGAIFQKKTKVTFKFNCLDDEMIKIEESEDAQDCLESSKDQDAHPKCSLRLRK